MRKESLHIVRPDWTIVAGKCEGGGKDGRISVEFKHDVQREGQALVMARTAAQWLEEDLAAAVKFAPCSGGYGGQYD